MTITFNLAKYDVGGTDATKGDSKLTGNEINLAREAGWDIDRQKGYTQDMGVPNRIEGADDFWKFTDNDGNFSWKKTGITLCKCLLSPLLIFNSCQIPEFESKTPVVIYISDSRDFTSDFDSIRKDIEELEWLKKNDLSQERISDQEYISRRKSLINRLNNVKEEVQYYEYREDTYQRIEYLETLISNL